MCFPMMPNLLRAKGVSLLFHPLFTPFSPLFHPCSLLSG